MANPRISFLPINLELLWFFPDGQPIYLSIVVLNLYLEKRMNYTCF